MTLSLEDRPSSRSAVPVCGIGASAGGVEALQKFFSALRNDLGLAYVVIVHLAPDRKSELPALISRWTSMPVVQVGDHEKTLLKENHVYVIAPDRKLELTDTSVGASSFEQPRGQRAAIDLFFRSLAATHGDGFAIVLSGSGSDGALGAKAVKESGGLVLVQDPNEAGHADMPRAAVATGVADVVLPVQQLATRLAELAGSKQRLLPVVRAAEGVEQIAEEEEKALKGIFDLLRKHTGHEFSKYKRTTVLRRLSRRMQLSHQVGIADYLRYLSVDATEVSALFDDLLISVTTFFRDPEAWAALQKKVIGPLVEETEDGEQIRAWVPGCATGEEAYSLAILFQEECERRKVQRSFIIFASDVDESALTVARDGTYPHAIGADVSEARLDRFFRSEDDHYRVGNEIRDHLVFASHSVLRDPPFLRLHLVSCRNLLIYLDRDLQEQIMSVFRYACRDHAYLFLGASEVADEEHFHALDKKHRIFVTTPGEGVRPALPEILALPANRVVKYGRDWQQPSTPMAAEIHVAALESASPPSMLVDDRWTVLHLSSSASRFFQQPGGALTRRATELVRPELRDEVHALLQRALEDPSPHLSPFVSVQFNGSHHRVALLAQRHISAENERRFVLLTFLDGGEETQDTRVDAEPSNGMVRSLRDKLRQSEQRIEGMRDDHYLINEDLRAANEELQSLNEEYRSTTEELETSKEELQSINEELQTVNYELKMKLEEVSRAHADLENLMAATNVATLFLSPDLRIKRFTPQLGEIFNVKSRDLDRPIGDLTHALDYAGLEEDARRVLASHAFVEREIGSSTGRKYIARLTPYRTTGGRDVDGVVITFIDVTEIKEAETALRESERKLEAELDVVRRLHRMSLSVAIAPTMGEALDEVLTAAMEVHGADLGTIQLLDRDSQRLRVVAHHGFAPAFLERIDSVGADDRSAFCRTMRTRAPSQIADIASDSDNAVDRRIAAEVGYRAVQSSPLISRDGDLVGVLSVYFREVHTFSERDKQVGDLLAQQAADLIGRRAQEERLARLNEALSKRTTELEESQARLASQASSLLDQDRNREEFLAALGHELRNPMAAVHNSLQLISVSGDRSRRALTILQRQTGHMTRLVNDLLDITRVKHGKLRLERMPVALQQSALAALETIRQEAKTKKLKLVLEPSPEPIFVDADPERLAQIFDNLLRNSITYTDKGAITLSLRREGTHARISVRDTGIGIDPDDAHSLFKPYQQRDQGHRGGGLGLGLTLVKGLVEAHGGVIGLRSEGVGRGSEFSFTIPLAQAADAPVALKSVEPKRSLRILVVDDQKDVADMFGAMLESLGQQVDVVYDGASAIARAHEQRPQVLFLDLSMPDMSGAEVARRIRKEFSPIPPTLVAVSGYGKDHSAARDANCDHHLVKPVARESVITLLNVLAEEARN